MQQRIVMAIAIQIYGKTFFMHNVFIRFFSLFVSAVASLKATTAKLTCTLCAVHEMFSRCSEQSKLTLTDVKVEREKKLYRNLQWNHVAIVNFSCSSSFVIRKIRKKWKCLQIRKRYNSDEERASEREREEERRSEMMNVLIVLELYIVFDAFTHKQKGKLHLETEAQQFTQFLQLPENISQIRMHAAIAASSDYVFLFYFVLCQKLDYISLSENSSFILVFFTFSINFRL